MENNPPPPPGSPPPPPPPPPSGGYPPPPPPPPTSGGYPPPPPGPGDPYPTYQGAAMGAQGYAGFWIRFVAWVIDAIVLNVLNVPVWIIGRILDPNVGSP